MLVYLLFILILFILQIHGKAVHHSCSFHRWKRAFAGNLVETSKTTKALLRFIIIQNQINDQDELAVTFVLIVIAFVVCHGFLTVFDMTLNTLFICFCDDCDQNDGKSRPYSMSENLLEVMKAVKKPEDIDFGDGEAAMEIKNGNEMQPVAI